jgi:hypothetical protein
MRARALVIAAAFAVAIPANALGVSASYMVPTGLVAGVTFTPLVNSGEELFGVTFEGLPDGIGVVPGPGASPTYVDLYVNHEQSHVPFGLNANSVYADGLGIDDPHDSSVTRVRVRLSDKAIIDMEEVLPGSAGFIRFCSSTIVSGNGFTNPVLFTNEESNDVLPVPAGATYGADPSVTPNRQAGYTVALDTVTGEYKPIPGMGRHNHENQVLIPGGWKNHLAFLSGDDTFSAPGSQLYMYLAGSAADVLNDNGHLYALRITADDGVKVAPGNRFNGANDYLDLIAGEEFSGKFIQVPDEIADGATADLPQTALENWSNENNVFQFIRVEDIAYDPDSPRTVYFADTGATVAPNPATGRLQAGTVSPTPPLPGQVGQRGRVFKMVMNATDPKVVDSLTVFADGNNTAVSNFNRPDNIAVGQRSIMIQEDTSNSRLWMYSFETGLWTAVARVDTNPGDTTNDPGENSGIIDMSQWIGEPGWWALDVQAHQDINTDNPTIHPDESLDGTFHTWDGGPVPPGPVIPPGGASYRYHRENGQLLLIYVPGS